MSRSASEQAEGTAGAMTKRSAQAGRTRQRIIDAALSLFSERGYDGTSLHDVAAHVGITKANLYYYFHTKAELVAAIAEPAYQLMSAALDDAERLAHMADRMTILTQRYVDMTLSRRALVRLLSRDVAIGREINSQITINSLRERTLDVLYGPKWGTEHQLALYALNGFADAVLAVPQRTDEELRPALLRAVRRLLDIPLP